MSAADPLEGTRIRDWEILRRLAVGGMGVVYEAVHTGIGRKAALKVLAEQFADAPEYAQRLGAEARALAGIAHRGVVEVFDAGVLPDGRPWLAMELLSGETLHAVLARGRPQLGRAVEILDQLLSALAAAHAAGLIHRDIKPANIFIVSRPFETPFVKVMDFGLVRRAPPGTSVPQTFQDRFVGTPGYMPPEQAMGKAVGPQSDLYAVGALAFELFTGERPFTHPDPIELARLHIEARVPRPSSLNPELPPALDRWVNALLEKNPDFRPAAADAVRRDLLRAMGIQTEETPAHAPAAAPAYVPEQPTITAVTSPAQPAQTGTTVEDRLRPATTAPLEAPRPAGRSEATTVPNRPPVAGTAPVTAPGSPRKRGWVSALTAWLLRR